MKRVLKRNVRNCPIHKAVLEACGKRLVEFGYFNKADILEDLSFSAIEDSLRWDWIAEFLSEKNGDYAIELVPLAQRFFKDPKRKRDATEITSLGRYLAGGHGKRTAGYASIDFEGGRFAVVRADRFKSLSNGQSAAFSNYVSACLEKKARLEDSNVAKLEQLRG
jgi:hypothetical protein